MFRHRLLTSSAVLAVLAGAVSVAPVGGYAAAANSGTVMAVHLTGTTSASARSGGTDGGTIDDTPLQPLTMETHVHPADAVVHVAANDVPNPAGNPVMGGQLGGFVGFNGISHKDQRLAGTGAYAGTQFSLEPPDQGLCVGNGFVVEAINDAVRVYDTSGNPVTSTEALNQFFGLHPAIHRTNPPTFGDFVSDPRCYFDTATHRWFLSALQITLNVNTEAYQAPAATYIAVSQTANPAGSWNIYSVDAVDANDPGCPCFGDQPLLGADANGIYLSTNEYSLSPFGAFYNGGQVYAMSKKQLESGASSVSAVHINAGPMESSEGGLAFSIQPATTPSGHFATAKNGTEYFVSSTDFTAGPALGSEANRIAVWAMTNTASLDTTPDVHLTHVLVSTMTYVQPPNAQQPSGPRPLGTAVHEPLELVAANDDRMNQVVFADGLLWSGLNTAEQTPNGPTRVGAAYFVVSPSEQGSGLSATLKTQGVVAVNQENVLFPSIGVTDSGKAVMSFTVVGPDYYPSAAYATIDAAGGSGAVHIAGAGQLPEDGFSGYEAFGGADVGRWGDYTAALADPSGNVWIAAEYIPNLPRTVNANWGTFVSKVTP